MRVKVNDTWYDTDDGPIMVELTDSDKTHIANMLKHATKYAAANEGYFNTSKDFSEWMSK